MNLDNTITHVISIHSLRMEGDAFSGKYSAKCSTFQSTPSAWRETAAIYLPREGVNISIHSLRMEGDGFRNPVFHRHTISIHSLRMEGDRNGTAAG